MSVKSLDTRAVLAFPLTGIALIEASAGTGKTYTIANLYLRHVVSGREVGELLVVTFTKAATDELRGRIRARLFETLDLLEQGGQSKDAFLTALVEGVRAGSDLDRITSRLRLAVRAMDEAAIYTIHGFCQRALTEFAFNSGQGFQLDVLGDDADLWREAVRDWWRRTGYPLAEHEARLLVDALGGLDAFTELLRPLLGADSRRLLPETASLAELLDGHGELRAHFRVLATEWQQDGERLKAILKESNGLSRAQTSPYGARLEGILEAIDAWAGSADLPPPLKALEALTPEGFAKNAKKAEDPALEDPFFVTCGELLDDLERLRRRLRTAALREAAAFARARVGEVKERAQALSYNDLLTRMRDALAGEGGPDFAESLRRRFPVAMIDEFQDTDAVQYAIFRALYLDRPECGLIMIGDPKQAIYSFRGGDIFTYMQARRDVGEDAIHTLGVNWRSTPEVVAAVNGLFLGRPEDAFVYGEAIPFEPVAAAERDHEYLIRDGVRQPALTLWSLPDPGTTKDGRRKSLSKDLAHALCHTAVADEIARLLAEARAGRARIGDSPLVPGKIAVLVRSSYEAADLRRVLAAVGVSAVSVEREGVFASPEAGALEVLLRAVLEPRDRGLVRAALASPLLGRDFLAVARTCADEDAWVDWVDRLLVLHETWQRRGFMPMFQQMLRVLDLASAIAAGEGPERRLTNLLHLGELLAQEAKALAGPDALLAWYRSRRQEAAGEEAELRLESDAELVQIVTIHSSKGLQYPVVFVPYLWGCKARSAEGLVAFHKDDEACLDAGSERIEAHLRLAEQERLAEDVRLAYVALTRAESALYLAWGRAGSTNGAAQSALGYLLHPVQTGRQLASEPPGCFAGVADLGPDLERLAQHAGTSVRLAPIPEPDPPFRLPPGAAPPALAARRFDGRIRTDWRLASFSSLTRNLHQSVTLPREEPEDDPALRFPAGSNVGSYLHLLLELTDFQGDVEAQVLEHSGRIAPRFDLDHGRWGADAATLIARAVQTPIAADGPRLADLPVAGRLNELEFDFATGPVDLAALDRLLAEAAGIALPPLDAEAFRGMVNGVIDLVFEHGGRYYIADYKSNWLGGRLDHYAPEALRRAVYERRYDLQYLLYTLALHRYLGLRLPDYDYRRHFGGVYYLFLRGMRPQTGPARGVYHQRPDPALVSALDREVFARDTEADR